MKVTILDAALDDLDLASCQDLISFSAAAFSSVFLKPAAAADP